MDLYEFLSKVKGLEESEAFDIAFTYYKINYIPEGYLDLILEWYDFNFFSP